MKQNTNTILMVRPATFRLNEETAINNYYQAPSEDLKNKDSNKLAQDEFDFLVLKLKEAGIRVIIFNDDGSLDTPDSVFPNNWVSFHENGDVALYPMFAENRRRERREDILEQLENDGFKIKNIVDYTSAEEENIYLEGTGSLVLDRINRKAYCTLSPRADEELFIEFCEDFEYTPVLFTAYQTVDGKRLPIYHTNVMMCIGKDFAVICLDCIDDKKERKNVIQHLKADGKEVIAISEAQVENFAGNMLEVENKVGKSITVMSQSAYDSLTKHQIATIEKYSTILSSKLNTIETLGGGSARCMMAEVFLPKG
ncbi:MAG: amidinotransferase [Flavobacteriaceae bacterium CG2_30_34_30]|nr:amidinotransferase [Flavobacteriia bacterium]OIP50339.1 MAG: amidinotransferase [Flavobacteriaceae bacterium CG2_30_34_30]PIQ18418.1 MAG: amidinotransferase [Flavobacteriaceae bacterium CG18_big_fil_WC_8_21_14_2_50_34_36]PIV49853.1 MAG: amidinotransferase [Flavobacteriaceae bacterium CG02_land_8_20_14_3_00_34_13]PIZ06886.1 MAG: amidinotransferase [Flavobacteriaceae bacterium CG_4_10_14_0_8_um_filter_34_31]PJC07827.1 MAG: amidinotransferase [Flavobacteriaceae bacterium CG_4_9_14_0_8_um_filte